MQENTRKVSGLKAAEKKKARLNTKNTIHPSLCCAMRRKRVCASFSWFFPFFMLVFSSYLKLILRMKYITLIHMWCASSPNRVSHTQLQAMSVARATLVHWHNYVPIRIHHFPFTTADIHIVSHKSAFCSNFSSSSSLCRRFCDTMCFRRSQRYRRWRQWFILRYSFLRTHKICIFHLTASWQLVVYVHFIPKHV